MSKENSSASDMAKGLIQVERSAIEGNFAKGFYTVLCFDKDGEIKWEEHMPNLVMNVGLVDMNQQYFTGSGWTATWYLGLINGPGASNTYSATATMSSHTGWTENTGYSNATRPACTFGSPTSANPSVISNSASAASFNITATSTIGGAFLTSNNTKGGTTGTLFSAASFQSPGDRSVVNGDILTVTYTFQLTAT